MIVIIVLSSTMEFLNDYVPCKDPKDFHCSTGSMCIKSELECDGKNDCEDGSDEIEADCDLTLCRTPRYYTCKDNRTCIVQNFRCDSHNDCPSNDDERNCADYVPHHEQIECNENEFMCLKDNMCVTMDFLCDGERQCMDGSDEVIGCMSIVSKCKGFLCNNKH